MTILEFLQDNLFLAHLEVISLHFYERKVHWMCAYPTNNKAYLSGQPPMVGVKSLVQIFLGS